MKNHPGRSRRTGAGVIISARARYPGRGAARPADDTGELPVPPASARRPPASTPGKPLAAGLDGTRREGKGRAPRRHDVERRCDAGGRTRPRARSDKAGDVLSYRGPSTERLNTEDPTSEFDRRTDPQASTAIQRPTAIVPMPRSTMVPVIAAASLVAVAIVIAATLLRPDAPVSRSAALPDPAASVTEAVDLPTMRLRLGPGFPRSARARSWPSLSVRATTTCSWSAFRSASRSRVSAITARRIALPRQTLRGWSRPCLMSPPVPLQFVITPS